MLGRRKPSSAKSSASEPAKLSAPLKKRRVAQHAEQAAKPSKKLIKASSEKKASLIKKKAPLDKKEQKQLKKARRAKRPNAEAIQTANGVWSMGIAKLKPTDRQAKIASIIQSCKGVLCEVIRYTESFSCHRVCWNVMLRALARCGCEKLKSRAILQIAAKHDMARVLQLLIKYGSPAQRKVSLLDLVCAPSWICVFAYAQANLAFC